MRATLGKYCVTIRRREADIRRLACPFFKGDVELTDEREAHIRQRHPDLLPEWQDELARAIADPDTVVPAFVGDKILFVRWTDTIRGGRYVVVVVATDAETPDRHWIVTAYLSRRLPEEA